MEGIIFRPSVQEEFPLKDMEQLEKLRLKTTQLMTTCGAQHPKADGDRPYLQICEGVRGLIGLEDCAKGEAHSLEKYLNILKEKISKEE